MAALGMLLVVALFLVRPGANRLRTRIVASISMAVGRPVEVASVNLRLLPRPGFDLENFVVHEDPAYGAEAMLRAQEVTASLRLSSLLRGRLEIASLSLTEPSLNLTRNAEGHWNLENLVERAEKNPVAPTSKGRTETRPGFPYIEAQRGRINLKLGPEKKRYALTDADFALWQDTENTWGLRLKAQPVRTDFNLSDTGVIRVNGSWQRAASLHDTPVQFSLEWDRPQLGQLTKLIYGSDKGWRGTVRAATAVSGTPANLTLKTAASIDDFRRYDVMGGGDLRLATDCQSHYSSVDNSFSEIACVTPVGNGAINLAGRAVNPLLSPAYALTVTAKDLPIASLVGLFRHAKLGLPDDLVAGGRLTGTVKIVRQAQSGSGSFHWEGKGQASGVRLASTSTETDLAFDDVPFSFRDSGIPKRPVRHSATTSLAESKEAHMDIGPSRVALGRPVPLVVQGSISRSGYAFALRGEAQLQRLLQAARTSGLPVMQTGAEGYATVELAIGGGWTGFAAPTATGKAQLHSLRAPVRGLNVPLEISTASLTLAADQVDIQNLTASVAGATWHGSLVIPRPCAANACAVSFDLHADEMASERLSQLLNPGIRPQPWYRFLSSSTLSGNYLMTLNATGKLSADKITIGRLAGSRFSANVQWNTGKLQLSDVRAEVLSGRHKGEWRADFTAKPPQYSGRGTLAHASLNQLASAMHSNWITGSANTSYRVGMAGVTGSELLSSATATLQIDARDGELPHLALGEGAGPLQMRHLAVQLVLQDGKFEVENGTLEAAAARYELSGTSSADHSLHLKLTREGAPGFNITGTLTDLHVSEITTPDTRAALKP